MDGRLVAKLHQKSLQQVPAHYYLVSSLLNEKFNFRTKAASADDVFEKLSDVLLPHLYPQNFVSQTGVHKPRGVLLSGPPGTGKTFIARTICGMLNIQPEIVRGPEIFSRFLGESEKKIRELESVGVIRIKI